MNFLAYTVLFGVVSFLNALVGFNEFDKGAVVWGAAYIAFGIVTLLFCCASWKLYWMSQNQNGSDDAADH